MAADNSQSRTASSCNEPFLKVLVIRNDNIGDLVCTTPLLEALRKAYPKAIIDLLGNAYNIDILRHDPRVSRLWSYQKGGHFKNIFKKWRAYVGKILLLWRLRQEQYDLVLIATSVFNKRTTNLARWIHPKKIYGAPPAQPQKRLPSSYHEVSIDSSLSHVLQVLTYARALGLEGSPPKALCLPLSAEEKKEAKEERLSLLQHHPGAMIGIQISARRPKQQWSFEQWKELITALLPLGRIRIFWAPGVHKNLPHPGGDLLAERLQKAFPEGSIIVKPTQGLRTLMTALSTCDVLVGADGGAMHLAAALHVPTLTLFGDVDPAVWAPYSHQGTTLKSPSDLLTDLAPSLVAQKTKELLEASQKIYCNLEKAF